MAIKTSTDNYEAGINKLRSSPYMDYPFHVHIETMALCNAACVFCPYPKLERQKAVMPDELVEKIIDDLTAIPSNLPIQISPFKVNEPFLDSRLIAILRRINEKLPNGQIALTTNASPLTEKKLEQLKSIENIVYLWISFNDHRPEHYERTMSLSFERTMERLRTLHDKAERGEVRMPVVLSRVGDVSVVDQEFRVWVQEVFPCFQSAIMPRGGWIGQVDTTIGRVPDIGCIRWFDVSITATGVVAHCCMDGQAKWPIGDVTKQHVLEVYNSPKYRKLRARTRSRLDVAPCNRCTFK